MQILDHDHRALVGDRREEAAPGSERLLPARRLPRIDTEQRQQPGPQPRLLLHVRQDGVQLVGRSLGRVRLEDAGMRLDDLPERPERDPVSVWEAAAPPPDRRRCQTGGKLAELGQQPTLPDPRLADDRQEPPAAFVQRPVQRSPEPFQLHSAADQAHRSRGGGSRPGRTRTPHGHRLRLALRLDRIEPLVVEQALRLTIGQLADCDSSHRRGRLQPGGRVDDVARHDPLAELGASAELDDRLAAVDPDPHAQVEVGLCRIQIVDRLEHAQTGPNRPFGIVLVRHRGAEHRHHGVADELLDRAAEALDFRPNPGVIGRSRARTSSGSARSAAAVKPTRSQNSTDTTFRSSSAAPGAASASGVPQKPQNWKPSGFSRPQAGQITA